MEVTGPAAADEATGWLRRTSPLWTWLWGAAERERSATTVDEATGRPGRACVVMVARPGIAAWDVATDVVARTTARDIAAAAAVGGWKG